MKKAKITQESILQESLTGKLTASRIAELQSQVNSDLDELKSVAKVLNLAANGGKPKTRKPRTPREESPETTV